MSLQCYTITNGTVEEALLYILHIHKSNFLNFKHGQYIMCGKSANSKHSMENKSKKKTAHLSQYPV